MPEAVPYAGQPQVPHYETPYIRKSPLSNTHKPRLGVTVFTDYICPFCYVGDARLDKLRESYELDIDWCFFEIHPDNPPEGKPVEELGYPPEQWRQMMSNLAIMAEKEGLPLAPRTFTTNSHRAMLLAEATKSLATDCFERLHKRLFEAYFNERKNIGDPEVLRAIAAECDIPAEVVDRAWEDEQYEQRLRDHYWRGAQIGIQGVPGFLFGRHIVSGAVPTEVLERAAEYVLNEQTTGSGDS
jgi:predicted DsbA family dithiol-disulfide isomerase